MILSIEPTARRNPCAACQLVCLGAHWTGGECPAARRLENLDNSNTAGVRSFQLFGYDFVIDSQLRVWLCEVNASPAVADALRTGLVNALIRRAIDPLLPPDRDSTVRGSVDAASTVAGAYDARREDFECLWAAPQRKLRPHSEL